MAVKSLKVTTGNFSLQSKWRYKEQYVGTDVTEDAGGKQVKKVRVSGWKLVYGPTSSSKTITFKYSLPSGAKVKTVRIWAKISSGNSISVCTVNGASFSKKNGSLKGADVKIASTNGTLSAVFKYKASGGLYKDENTHTGTLRFENVYLLIEYEDGASKTPAKTPAKKSKGLKPPPQCGCIYDQEDGSIYLFDGILKFQHSVSLDIQEEPDNKKKEFVNNAKLQPDKLTLDVIMSDVYTGGGAIVNKAGALSSAQNTAFNKTKSSISREGSSRTRSENAYYAMHWLAQQRRKLSVITPQYVYVDMILESMTVNQDDQIQNGWEGQLTFQNAFKAKAVKKKKKSQDVKTNTPPGNAVIAGGG